MNTVTSRVRKRDILFGAAIAVLTLVVAAQSLALGYIYWRTNKKEAPTLVARSTPVPAPAATAPARAPSQPGVTSSLLRSPLFDPRDPFADPFTRFSSMSARMDRMMAQLMGAQPGSSPDPWAPLAGGDALDAMTISDAGTHYEVRVDLPQGENVNANVSVQGQMLSIEATMESQSGTGGSGHSSTSTSRTMRQFTLPGPVDSTGVRSEMEGKTLVITVPKAAAIAPATTIRRGLHSGGV